MPTPQNDQTHFWGLALEGLIVDFERNIFTKLKLVILKFEQILLMFLALNLKC